MAVRRRDPPLGAPELDLPPRPGIRTHPVTSANRIRTPVENKSTHRLRNTGRKLEHS
jgi:hypothetical protein